MGKKKITKGVVLQWCWSTWTDTKIAVEVVMDIADVETIPKTVENNDEKKIHQHFQCSFCRTDSFCESLFLRLNVMFWHILNEVQKVQEPLFCPKWNKNIFHQNQTHFSYTLPSISSVPFTLLGNLLWKSRTPSTLWLSDFYYFLLENFMLLFEPLLVPSMTCYTNSSPFSHFIVFTLNLVILMRWKQRIFQW